MTVGRRRFIALGTAALAAPALLRQAHAQQPVVVLKLHHFLSPVAYAHTRFLTPWAKSVEKDFGGRIRIDLFPSMQLGGTASQLYDQAVNGTADIVWTLPGMTPGRFPRIEVFELPFVANQRALANTRAVQQLYETRLRDEFREVQPICLWAHDRGVLHTNKPINRLEDLKGLKLRAPTRLANEALKALGANGISLPVPQIPDALAQKVIDGCLVPWEVVPAIKLQERVKFHTEIAGSPTLYTATFILAMNKARYDSLPPDLKKVIDQTFRPERGADGRADVGRSGAGGRGHRSQAGQHHQGTRSLRDRPLGQGDATGGRCLGEGIQTAQVRRRRLAGGSEGAAREVCGLTRSR